MISIADRRRLLVQRHLMGEAGRADRSELDVASALGLLHSTDPSTPYLSIHARSDTDVDDIDQALYAARSLIRFTTIRRTVFVMDHHAAAGAFGCFNAAVAEKLRTQLIAWLETSDDVSGSAATYLAETEDAVVTSLRTDGPATGAQLAKRVPPLQATFDPMPGASYSKPIRATSKVLEIMGAELRITRGRPAGDDFTSAAWTWEACDDVSSGRVESLDADAALVRLLDRYLAAFEPATVTDMSWWTGLTKTKVRVALATLEAVEVELEDSVEAGYVGSSFDGADAGSEVPVVALLPGLDPTTMGWKQRNWYVDDDVSAGFFDRNGNAGPTVWVDGQVVGAWSQRPDGEIAVEVRDEVGGDALSLVDAEVERLREWLGHVRIKWRYPTAASRRLS